MLLTIGVLVTLITAVIVYRTRVSWRANDANLGWMSAQWLAEHRASSSS